MIRLALLLSLLASPAFAQTSPMLDAMRRRDWGSARLLAATPLAVKLVDFIRLLTPEQAQAAETLDFLQRNPGWPDRPALEERYGEALRQEGDERDVARLCDLHAPRAPAALARCADAYALSNQPKRAAVTARAAWAGGITGADEENAFLARWGQVLTDADQAARFAHIIGNAAAALRQLPRLPADQQRLGAARLALRRQDPAVPAILAAVPETLRDDPFLLLDQARYLRRIHALPDAAALWKGALGAAEPALDSAQRGAFWAERDSLVRALMVQGDAADAYAIAQDGGLPDAQAQESQFLAGWIALEGLHRKEIARTHFAALQAMAHSALGQSRGAYWLGRATDDAGAAREAYQRAARWPLTFYGQRAARAAGNTAAEVRSRIAGLQDAPLPPGVAAAVQGRDLFKAAQLLIGWQDPRRAADFFLRLLEPPASEAERQVVAEAALAEGLPDVAMAAARLIGKDGGALPVSGWPRPVPVPSSEASAALILAIMRQESGFDSRITSAAGAQGLMQLMPGTARDIARANHLAAGPLISAGVNARLGSLYLVSLLHRFGGVEPFAVAAYNAGPRRVQEWLDAQHPDTDDDAAMIDWIEAIPFAETRNYVERVLENEMIYQARTGE